MPREGIFFPLTQVLLTFQITANANRTEQTANFCYERKCNVIVSEFSTYCRYTSKIPRQNKTFLTVWTFAGSTETEKPPWDRAVMSWTPLNQITIVTCDTECDFSGKKKCNIFVPHSTQGEVCCCQVFCVLPAGLTKWCQSNAIVLRFCFSLVI